MRIACVPAVLRNARVGRRCRPTCDALGSAACAPDLRASV